MKNSKCYLDRKGWDRKHSGQIWSTMWIRKDDRGGCLDQIWRDIWIGTDDKGCSIEQTKCCDDLIICDMKHSRTIWSIMWIRTEERGWGHDLIWGDICKGTEEKVVVLTK
jgi:hypothetical protein